MNKTYRGSLLVLCIATSLISACSADTTSAPRRAMRTPGQPDLALLSSTTIDFKKLYPGLSTQVPSVSTKGDTTIQKFTVNPKDGKLIVFGKTTGHVIAIPANTLCDPKATSYGPTEWLNSCKLASASVSFEVHSWNDELGLPHAEFLPNIRFSPSAPDPVRIYFQAPQLQEYAHAYIPYCDSSNNCVKEDLTDSALETYVSPLSTGGFWVYRTLRHFSGYMVAE